MRTNWRITGLLILLLLVSLFAIGCMNKPAESSGDIGLVGAKEYVKGKPHILFLQEVEKQDDVDELDDLIEEAARNRQLIWLYVQDEDMYDTLNIGDVVEIQASEEVAASDPPIGTAESIHIVE
ncbi:DUF3221 domain-containing protein [Marinicrinis sediminis]|uniref:DUF3221 domain-containing protein n=1 Tax=Marinicrinis sediminis TaxID=1652465 RepID=A0ABW5RB78_9BACL